MKKTSFLFLCATFLAISASAYSLPIEGAWISKNNHEQTVLLLKDGYFTLTIYDSTKFLSTEGGTFHTNGEKLGVSIEFNSEDTSKVGKNNTYNLSLSGNQLSLTINGRATVFSRVDNGVAPLGGVWKISGREQDGKLIAIHQTGSRKTLKLLTNGRFQWFAINPESKQFSGTGGGTYTFTNGKYTEHIEFFSRDNSRIKAKLSFDGKLEDGNWHHSGLSSKGDKIYEIWTKVKS